MGEGEDISDKVSNVNKGKIPGDLEPIWQEPPCSGRGILTVRLRRIRPDQAVEAALLNDVAA